MCGSHLVSVQLLRLQSGFVVVYICFFFPNLNVTLSCSFKREQMNCPVCASSGFMSFMSSTVADCS